MVLTVLRAFTLVPVDVDDAGVEVSVVDVGGACTQNVSEPVGSSPGSFVIPDAHATHKCEATRSFDAHVGEFRLNDTSEVDTVAPVEAANNAVKFCDVRACCTFETDEFGTDSVRFI